MTTLLDKDFDRPKWQRHKWCTKSVLIFLNFVCCSLKWINWNAKVMYKVAHVHKPLNAEFVTKGKKRQWAFFLLLMLLNELIIASHRDWICAIADGHHDPIETLSIFFFYIKHLYRNNLSKLKSSIWHKQSEGIKWRVPHTDLSLTAESMIYVAYAYLYICNVKVIRAQRLGFFSGLYLSTF